MRLFLPTLAALALAATAQAQQQFPQAAPRRGGGDPPGVAAGDYTAQNFRFESGETLPALRLHYRTLGRPRKDARGVVRNAVLVLHGTGGAGTQFLSPQFALLYGAGQPFDTSRFYVILPDDIGHGGSSKPSDGTHMKFPHYGYTDMVRAEHLLVSEGLGVNHLRVVIGTSMGCMHAWMWGEAHPDFVDGLVPLACAPTQIAGRNRMIRRLAMDAIRSDPAWRNGEYTSPPVLGLRGAMELLWVMGTAPIQQHAQAPTRDAADSVITAYMARQLRTVDANDFLYQFDSSRDYDPSAALETITAPVLAINSADDEVNPPSLGIMERLMPRVAHGKYILIPESAQTRGHGTHTAAAVWKAQLTEFLSSLPER
jgi:homoserine O-acetyltransferase